MAKKRASASARRRLSAGIMASRRWRSSARSPAAGEAHHLHRLLGGDATDDRHRAVGDAALGGRRAGGLDGVPEDSRRVRGAGGGEQAGREDDAAPAHGPDPAAPAVFPTWAQARMPPIPATWPTVLRACSSTRAYRF